MERPSTGIRMGRDLCAALAVIVLSFFVLFVPIIIYAFVLAFRARGAPDQAAINHFAATISPLLMPWLERVLTFLLAFWIVRQPERAHAADGLVVGALSGLLSLGVIAAFGGRLDPRSLLLFVVLAGLGAHGGFLGERGRPQHDRASLGSAPVHFRSAIESRASFALSNKRIPSRKWLSY